MRTIGVVTVARSDYGIYLPILRRIQDDPDLRLHLIVAGTHLSTEFGLTVRAIEEDGFEIGERVETVVSSDTPEAIATSMGRAVIGFGEAYARHRPDILLTLGDRYEMHAAVAAALPFAIPVAHIHGGELSEGAIDDALRHSITKMSHLHFVATEEYGRRVIQMGEESWRVTVSGAPSLDNLATVRLLDRDELHKDHGLQLEDSFLLATYHPVTLQHEDAEAQARELLAALEESGYGVVFTYPGADTHSRMVIEMIREFAEHHPRAQVVTSLGTQGYFSVMAQAAAMAGNSSSGIVEAASFKLPVVNVGSRQRGRARAANIIDVECVRSEIAAGIKKAVSDEFRSSLSDLVNPYGDGHAAERIVDRLKNVELDEKLLMKRFRDQ